MTERYDEFSPAARAAALLAASEPHVGGQHVVSKVVLKNFEGPVDGVQQIGIHNVRFGPRRPIGRGRAGLARDLLRVGSTSAEGLWRRTENHLDHAVEAVRLRGSRATPLSLGWIRKGVNMHFARGKVTVGILDGMWGQRGPELMADLADRARTSLTRQFHARHGRSPSDAELVELVAEYTSDGTQLNETGAWTRARVEQIFNDLNGPDRVGRRMIVTRPAPGSEFLIADNPVSTYRFTDGEAPIRTRHAWDAADEIVMPFAPDLAVCLVRDDVRRVTAAVPVEDLVATEERTVELNARQIRGAQESVFYRLGTDFSAEIAEALSR